jgi:transcriptional regulator with XRE-family HTH domain
MERTIAHISSRSLRIALASMAWSQLDLARGLGVPPTSLSAWLRGIHPGPSDLVQRIEHVLGLSPGALANDGGNGSAGAPTDDRK